MTTWTFDADSKIIRFYLWLWNADPSNIDFCRLFWGYVFCWVALILKPAAAIAEAIDGRTASRPKRVPTLAEHLKAEDLRREKKAAKAAKWENSRLNGLLTKFEDFGTRHGATLSKLFRGALVIVGGLVALATAGLLLYTIVTNFTDFLAAVGLLLGVALVAGAIFWISKRTTAAKRVDIAATKAWNGTKFFGRFLVEGERHVKNRTCPKIVVRGAEDTTETKGAIHA